MRIFLTGASGYIGSRLAARLVADGHEVCALVRPTSDRTTLDRIGARCFAGDVTDRYSMREGMSGADWVIHAAADLEFGGPAARQRAVNVDGSENVASLAFKLGVGRLLAISSIAVFGGSPSDGAPANEESPVLEPLPSLYGVTKRQGDRAISAWAERGLRVNTAYPSLVYGPPGKKRGGNALLRQIALGRLPALVAADRKTSWVHLDDLVEGLVRVMDHAPPGEEYLFAGDAITVAELAEVVAGIADASPPRLRLPLALARLVGEVSRPWYRLRGRRSPFLPDYLRSLARHWVFDDAKARRELGWERRSLARGLPETVRYLVDHG